ncbi:hypothetical protein PtB15_1B663 [Puccinia triticina]|nr:hypothetical protein PtB15_1B663 [Puccinia triticina]
MNTLLKLSYNGKVPLPQSCSEVVEANEDSSKIPVGLVPSISISQAVEDHKLQDQLPMAKSGGNVNKSRLPNLTGVFIPPSPAPESEIYPMETTEDSLAAKVGISASAPAPVVEFLPEKRDCPGKAEASLAPSAAKFVNPPAKRF